MLTLLQSPASHVVAVRLEGKVTDDDVARVVELVEGALERSERLNLLFDLTQVDGIEPIALFRDLAAGLKNVGRIYRFQQMAVITDNESLSKVVAWEDWLFKSIEIKRFTSQDSDQAFSWVETRLELPPPGFEFEHHKDYLELTYGERVTGHDVTRLADIIHRQYEASGPVRILARAQGTPRLGPGALYEKMWQFKLLGLLARCAVVGPDSLAGKVKAFNTLMDIQLKHFSTQQTEEALAWLTDLSPAVEMLPSNSPHTLAMRISGKITAAEVGALYAALLPHMKGDSSVDVLLEVPYQDGITFSALFQALKLGIKHYSKVTTGLRRLAIITDSRLLTKATEVENVLTPSIEERPFTFAQRDIALAWLQEGRPLPAALEPPRLTAAEVTRVLEAAE